MLSFTWTARVSKLSLPVSYDYVELNKCNRARFHICTNVNETDTFDSNVTGKTYRINHEFSCVDKHLTYLVSCNKCNKQYWRQTVEIFLYRWNNYQSNCRRYVHLHGETCMIKHLFEHLFFSMTMDVLIFKWYLNKVYIWTDPWYPLKREIC